jgi:hypothetical protein
MHSGSVVCRYNHYKKSFPVLNGVLQWKDVDEEYSFSFVFRGAYSRELELLPTPADGASGAKHKDSSSDASLTTPLHLQRCALGEYFIGVVPGQHYVVRVEEGPEGVGAEGLRIRDGPIRATSTAQTPAVAGKGKGEISVSVSGAGSKAGNSAVQDITKELMNMKVSDLHGDLARQLREARDIEDVLFSH